MSGNRRLRGAVVGLLGLALAAAATLGTGAAASAAEASPGEAEGVFTACPSRAELPEGADPALWRCEVMTATGHLKVGRVDVPLDRPVVVTHAEGRIDGEFRQVFGGLRTDPVRIPGTALRLQTRYGGSFDFHTDEERMGELDVVFGLSGPGLPRGCSAGTGEKPVHLILQAVGEAPGPGQIPTAEDSTFAAPRSSGCGPLGRVLDRALGLPSASGENSISLNGRRDMRDYTDLP